MARRWWKWEDWWLLIPNQHAGSLPMKICSFFSQINCCNAFDSERNVHQIMTNYRASVRKLSKVKKRIRKGVRSYVGSQQVQSINQYWEETTKRPIKIRDIKHYVWPISQEQKPPHNSTISRILKKELGMSFKVLQKRNPKTRQEENARLFHEAIAIQVFLRENDFELIYIDEFSYSSKK